MGRAKNTLNAADVSSTPIKVRYSVTYPSSSFSNYGITLRSGSNIPYSVAMSPAQIETMNNYRVIKQLYYQNYLTGSLLNTASAWDPDWVSTAASGSGDETIYYLPTGSSEEILIFTIPSTQFGEQISRNSFALSASDASYMIVDDGNGNLIDLLSSNSKVGNLFYAQGIGVITNQSYAFSNQYYLYLTSEITVYQNEVRCLINENDFNYTLNPSANKAGTSGSYINAVTGSDFHPYFTTVGLYNDSDELLLVGKMSKPYPVPPNTDMAIIVRWDS